MAESTNNNGNPEQRSVIGLAVGAAVVVLWAYWPTFMTLWNTWSANPQYSHGYLVPLFAAVLLWFRKEYLPALPLTPSWWGLAVVGLAFLMRLGGAFLYFEWLEEVSLLPCLAGLVLMVGGWPALRWAWPGIGFLIFMVPLPHRLEAWLPNQLQTIATRASTFTMQTLGLPAFSEGNTIMLNETRIGVVEACSGLSMLMIFIALSTAVAFVIKRPAWEKVLILLSAIPIALIANVTRITVTGILYETSDPKVAEMVFHDLAGWLMMPLALGVLWLELKLLGRLLVEPAPIRALKMNLSGPRRN